MKNQKTELWTAEAAHAVATGLDSSRSSDVVGFILLTLLVTMPLWLEHFVIFCMGE